MALLITEPVGIKLTTTNEIDRTGGRSSLVRGVAGFRQGVHVRMKMVRGELFWNQDAGRPYVARSGIVTPAQALLGQKFDIEKAKAIFREPIVATPGYLAVLRLDVGFVVATRVMSVAWAARTIWGETPEDEMERTL